MRIGNMETPERRLGPSRWWYVVAGGIILSTAVGTGAFTVFRAVTRLVPGQQVVVPGEGRLTFSRPGSYTIFHEYQSVVDGKMYANPQYLTGLECALKESKTGRVVKLSPVKGNVSYSGGSRAGVGILEFDITEPGEYVLRGAYSGGGANGPAVLAIAHEFLGELLVLILGGIGIMSGGSALAILIFVLTFLKRRKARQEWEYSRIPPMAPPA